MSRENQLGKHIQEWLIFGKVYILFFLVVFGGHSLIAADKVYVYPGLPGNLYQSTRYVVSVSQSGNTYDSYVYNSVNTYTIYYTEISRNNMTDDNNFTSFSFDGTVVITITLPLRKTAITSVEVRPSIKGITATWVGNKITIPISTAGNYYVRINGEEKNPLFIFANPLEKNPPLSSGDPNALYLTPTTFTKTFSTTKKIWYFMPGVYDIGSSGGTLQNIPSGKTVYIAGGAFVKGLLKSSGGGNLTVRGRGILSGIDIAHIPDLWSNFMVNGETTVLSVEGIISTDAPQPNFVTYVSGSTFNNVKIFGWNMNNDAFDHGENTTVKNCFIKTNDDALKPGIAGSNYKDNVVWIQVVCSAIQFGWNQRVDKPGSNIMVDGVDIIGNDNIMIQGAGDNNCIVSLRNVDGATYSGITVQNVRSDVEVNYIFSLAIKGTLSGYTQGLGMVDGINFKNFTFPLGQRYMGSFNGNGTNTGEIKNVNFDCITIKDTLLTSANASTYFTRMGKTSGFTYANSCATSVSQNIDLEMNGFSIFPNPANDSLTIKIFGFKEKQQIQIFNSVGELMKEFEITQVAQINVSDFSKGIYFISLKNNPQQTQKFMKQ